MKKIRTLRAPTFGYRNGLAVIAILAAGIVSPVLGTRAMAQSPSTCTLDRASGTTIDAEPFMRNAWGSRWNLATNRVAYIQPNAKGYYRIFTVSPNGGTPQAITAGQPGLPPDRHQGTLYWHPSGRYLMFAAEKPEWSSLPLFGLPDYEAMPGFGRHDDLWLITADGLHSWQLTHEPNTQDQGIAMPVFAPDGRHIAWSSRQPGGKYVLKVAEFMETPEPHIENIKSYQPGGEGYYETGSFTSDSKSLTYTSDQDTHSFLSSQIYILDLATGKGTRLTRGNDYNELPIVVATPTGDWIVYMSNKGVDRFPSQSKLEIGTDWYAMKTDGSGVKRLTTMNVNRTNNPENAGYMLVACTVAVGPSGDLMLGDVQDNATKQTGMIRRVHFTCR
jgi:Tol biopolymer transport system component